MRSSTEVIIEQVHAHLASKPFGAFDITFAFDGLWAIERGFDRLEVLAWPWGGVLQT